MFRNAPAHAVAILSIPEHCKSHVEELRSLGFKPTVVDPVKKGARLPSKATVLVWRTVSCRGGNAEALVQRWTKKAGPRAVYTVDGVKEMSRVLCTNGIITTEAQEGGPLNHRLFVSNKAWADALVAADPTMTILDYRRLRKAQHAVAKDGSFYDAVRDYRTAHGLAPLPRSHRGMAPRPANWTASVEAPAPDPLLRSSYDTDEAWLRVLLDIDSDLTRAGVGAMCKEQNSDAVADDAWIKVRDETRKRLGLKTYHGLEAVDVPVSYEAPDLGICEVCGCATPSPADHRCERHGGQRRCGVPNRTDGVPCARWVGGIDKTCWHHSPERLQRLRAEEAARDTAEVPAEALWPVEEVVTRACKLTLTRPMLVELLRNATGRDIPEDVALVGGPAGVILVASWTEESKVASKEESKA